MTGYPVVFELNVEAPADAEQFRAYISAWLEGFYEAMSGVTPEPDWEVVIAGGSSEKRGVKWKHREIRPTSPAGSFVARVLDGFGPESTTTLCYVTSHRQHTGDPGAIGPPHAGPGPVPPPW